MLLIVLLVVLNWHITHLAPWEAAFHTKCILSELVNSKACWTGVTLIAGLLRFTVIASIAAHGMPAPHTVCYSGKQVGLHQIKGTTHLKFNPSHRKWLQATEWGGGSIYHRSCSPIDARHAAQAGAEVTVTRWPAAATGDATLPLDSTAS